jgi:hypothetical protein
MKRIWLVAVLLLSPGAWALDYLGAIPWGADSQSITITLWDQDTPETCPSTDLDDTTAALVITVRANNEANATSYNAAKILSCTPGSYSTPTNSDEIRFCVVDASSCLYDLQIRNERFEVANAERLYITAEDGGADIMDMAGFIDLTVVSSTSFITTLLGTDCSAYVTPGTVGYLCVITDAIQDAVTTIDSLVDTIVTAVTVTIPALINSVGGEHLYDGVVDSVTSQTILVMEAGPAEAGTNEGRSLCVDGADSDVEEDCALITDYNESTFTFTLANALKFTVEVGDAVYVPAQDVNVKSMNSAEVCGNGQTGTPWTGNGC